MYLLISLLANAFQTYNIYNLTTCFLRNRRVAGKWEGIAYIVLFLQLTIPYLVFHVAGITLFCSLTGCLWITLLYHSTWKKRLLSGVFVCITMILAESIVSVLAGYVNLEFFRTTEYFSIFGMVCAPIVEYMVVRMICNFKNLRRGESVPFTYWLISITLPVCSIALYLLFYQQNNWSQWELFSCILFLFLINIFVFFLYDHQIAQFQIEREKEVLELQNEYQREQLDMMSKMEEKMQRQRHDFVKHISMLFYLNESGKQEKIREYIREIQDEIPLGLSPVQTGNSVIDSILNYKLREVEEKGIPVATEIAVPCDLELSAYDMNLLLTNLLDNAIEASKGEEEKQIEIAIWYVHHKLNVHIRNRSTGEIHLERDQFATTKEDKANHGYGIKIVREVVEKYNGLMEIKTPEGWFEVKIGLIMR